MRHTSIEVTNRQIGWVIAVVMMISLGSFSVGYFLGEKKAADRFVHRVEQDVFADKIYSSMCSLYDGESESESPAENGPVEQAEQANEEGAALANQEEEQENSSAIEKMVSNNAFYAQLVGFGTSKKAKLFVDRLANKGIVVHMRERKSKTARGKNICWYQVVTDPYTDKNALVSLVEKVKQAERLHDVRIVTI